MAQVLLFTSPYFRGTISDTPSGQAYHVEPGQTVVADDADVTLLQSFGFTSAAPNAASGGDVVGPGSATDDHLAVFDGTTGKLIKDGGAIPSGTPLTLSDGSSHTITNTASIVLGTGGTLSGTGGVGTISGFGSGGGGGYVFADGLGISNDTITNPGTVTINNTGTIVLPAASSNTGSGAGILLSPGAPGTLSGNVGSINIYGPKINQPGTAAPVYGGATYLFGSNVNITDTAGSGGGGYVQGGGGGAAILNGLTAAIGAQFRMNGGYILGGSTATGGSGSFYAGAAQDAATNIGGNFSITAGAGSTQGGNLTLGAGTGAMNGVLLINNQGTIGTDPHVLNADWVSSVAGVGFVVMRSQG